MVDGRAQAGAMTPRSGLQSRAPWPTLDSFAASCALVTPRHDLYDSLLSPPLYEPFRRPSIHAAYKTSVQTSSGLARVDFVLDLQHSAERLGLRIRVRGRCVISLAARRAHAR